jgi:hypothetical protein
MTSILVSESSSEATSHVSKNESYLYDWFQGIDELVTFRRKIDVFGSTVNGFGRAKTAGLPAVFFEGLW